MQVVIADHTHLGYTRVICHTIEESAKLRGTGIARRSEEYLATKIKNGNAVIALDGDKFAGFCYIETWSHGRFVVNSGLIVHPDYRGQGLAKTIKSRVFEHSRTKFPEAKIFGITTGLAVMKINYALGYEPVTFSELTDDPEFWKGCQTCKNYDILTRTERKMCLCTGMLFNPQKKRGKARRTFNEKVFSRLKGIKSSLNRSKEKEQND